MFRLKMIPGLAAAAALIWGSGALLAQTGAEKKQDPPKQTEKPPQDQPSRTDKEPTGTFSLSVSIQGQHTQQFHGNQGWPFKLGGKASVSAFTLTKGGTEALKAIFGSLTDSANGGASVSTVSGDFRYTEGKVSGNVKIEWEVQGNTLYVSADLEGSISENTAKISGKNIKVGGEWDWNGGVAQLSGRASKFEVASK